MISALVLLLLQLPLSSGESSSAYLGMTPPKETPEIFAPGVVSTEEEYEFGSVFSADGLEFYYGVELGTRTEIRSMTFSEGQWGSPVIVLSDERFSYNDPFLSLDDQRLYFISNRGPDGKAPVDQIDLWFVERVPTGWSEPKPVPGKINSDADEYYTSFTEDGSLFFSSNIAATDERRRDFDIYSAPETPDGYGEPIALEGGVNSRGYEADPFVSPDGSYIIFGSARRGGLGQGDLYVSFRAEDGTWLDAQSFGRPINTEGHELCPFVSRDGRYLFYTSNRDIYWVDTAVIDRLRPGAGPQKPKAVAPKGNEAAPGTS